MILYLLGSLLLLVAAGLGLPHPAGWDASTEPACAKVELFVRSNGVHTDLVLPEHELSGDWEEFLDLPSRLAGASSPRPRYLSFGWGEETFYLEVREFEDLTVGKLWTALLDSPGTLMHVELLGPLEPSERLRPVGVCKEDLARLESYVRASFQTTAERRARFAAPGYGRYDWFYKAFGGYSLTTTCNTWTARGLRTAGVSTPLWGAFAGPILWHLPEVTANGHR